MKTAGRPKTTTPEQVHERQAAGMTQAQAAEALGVSLSTVRAHWHKQPRGSVSPYADQIAAQIAKGKTDKEIAEATGASVATVCRHRRKIEGARNAPGQGRKPQQ